MDGPRTIDVIYAYIVDNDDGYETVPVILIPDWDQIPGQVMVPLVAADTARMNALRRVIFSAPELKGKTVRLVKFTTRRIVDVMKPQD